jgi:hypothetical protein
VCLLLVGFVERLTATGRRTHRTERNG